MASRGAARAETLLRLSATATVMVQPDELAADLAAEATAATPEDAQARVNAAITQALAAARATAGVMVATGRYSVWQVREPPPPGQSAAHPAPMWQASQAVMLHSTEGAPMLALVGRLQAQGLAVQRLGWEVSRAASERAEDQARSLALGALRGRAEAAAKLLGLHFEEFRSVDLNPSSPTAPMPRALMAAAMPAPNAAAEAVPISATVAAEAALAP